MENGKQQFDVIISGGGLSGTLMALSLSKLSKADGSLLSIAIVEAQTVQQSIPLDNNALFDARVLALSHGSAKYLAELGIWQHLQGQACAITDIDISDRGHFAKARLTAKEHNVNALGYVVDMALIGKAQLNALKSCQNIHWFSPDSIINVDWHQQSNTVSNNTKASSDQLNVTLKSGVTLSTALLLGCDGVNSPVRQLANIEITSSDYNQVALIANVSTTKPHNNKAFERFTEFGPIAMLPLRYVKGAVTSARYDANSDSHSDSHSGLNSGLNSGADPEKQLSRCSLVWTMTPEQAQVINSLDDDAFKIELEKAFGSYLGTISHVGKRDMFPLTLLQAQQQTYHRMALVGNSSHTIHPVAGQGFNLGLRDVKVMTELVSKALTTKQDLGSFTILHQYQQDRVNDQNEVIALTDSLISLFANDLPPLVVGRNIGLKALDILSPLKNMLVKKAMGY